MNIYEYVMKAPEHGTLELDQEQLGELRKWLSSNAARIGQLRAIADGLREKCVEEINADLVADNNRLKRKIGALQAELKSTISRQDAALASWSGAMKGQEGLQAELKMERTNHKGTARLLGESLDQRDLSRAEVKKLQEHLHLCTEVRKRLSANLFDMVDQRDIIRIELAQIKPSWNDAPEWATKFQIYGWWQSDDLCNHEQPEMPILYVERRPEESDAISK